MALAFPDDGFVGELVFRPAGGFIIGPAEAKDAGCGTGAEQGCRAVLGVNFIQRTPILDHEDGFDPAACGDGGDFHDLFHAAEAGELIQDGENFCLGLAAAVLAGNGAHGQRHHEPHEAGEFFRHVLRHDQVKVDFVIQQLVENKIRLAEHGADLVEFEPG